MGVYLTLIAQWFLWFHLHVERAQPLHTDSHPPIDFSVHSAVLWMYRSQVQQAALQPLTDYCQQIFNRLQSTYRQPRTSR